MNITKEIDRIKKELEELNDEALVEAIKKLLKFAKTKPPGKLYNPITEEDYIKRAMVAEEDIKYNRLTDIDDLEKESENW